MAMQPDDDDFSFEIEDEAPVSEAPEKPEIEVEDDTPEADRGREPMPSEIVQELENDDLEEYSEKVKLRLKQMKKVWHDERREKERMQREQIEALAFAQRMYQENNQLKGTLYQGEGTLIATAKQAAQLEADQARREYKEAYESGDSDRLVDAQDKLSQINLRLQQLNSWKPTLQAPQPAVQFAPQPVQAPRLDQKTIAWQERNTWWGNDPEMTAAALGLHQKLADERGQQYVGSDEYWTAIDKTMRRRFPDYFGDEEVATGNKSVARDARATNVVAPASRSRSPKKVVLKQSQLSIAKKLGLTPEQYARELMKTEN